MFKWIKKRIKDWFDRTFSFTNFQRVVGSNSSKNRSAVLIIFVEENVDDNDDDKWNVTVYRCEGMSVLEANQIIQQIHERGLLEDG